MDQSSKKFAGLQVQVQSIKALLAAHGLAIEWNRDQPYRHPKYVVPAEVSHNRYEDADPTLGGLKAEHIRELEPTVKLPDGKVFTTWDDLTVYSRVFHVKHGHPLADDANDGSAEKPWRTIGRAAAALKPGEKVVIHEGVYRERVIPARGGTGPEQMIAYEAAAGERVVIKGSRVYEGPWSSFTGVKIFGAGERTAKTHRVRLPREWFVGCLPFGMCNEQMRAYYRESPFYDVNKLAPKHREKMMLRRGLVFQDGRRLRQVRHSSPDLLQSDGVYWCEGDGRTIHIRPFGDVEPSGCVWEFTVQDQVFCPDETGLGFIRVRGLTIEHAADEFPVSFKGALSNHGGHHWIIEDCTVRQANATGINLGSEFWHALAPSGLGYDIVRRNVISDCGVCGLAGMGHPHHHLLVEDNLFERIGWQNFEWCWNAACTKLYTTLDSVVRRNLFRDSLDTSGVYFDIDNANTRVTENVFLDMRTPRGAVVVEMCTEPIVIDGNVFVNIRKGEDLPGVLAGGEVLRAIVSDGVTFTGNVVAGADGPVLHIMIDKPQRVAQGRSTLGLGFVFTDNVCVDSAMIAHQPRMGNVFDCNVYDLRRCPSAFHVSEFGPLHHLESWRQFSGQDQLSVNGVVQCERNDDEGTLRLRMTMAMPKDSLWGGEVRLKLDPRELGR